VRRSGVCAALAERHFDALQLYNGDFVPGMFVPRAPELTTGSTPNQPDAIRGDPLGRAVDRSGARGAKRGAALQWAHARWFSPR
jgi:hypothetical protein